MRIEMYGPNGLSGCGSLDSEYLAQILSPMALTNDVVWYH